MDINEALVLLENDYVEKDIKALSPKDRLNFWSSLKEFSVPKIQRSVFEPTKQDDIKIIIEYGNNTAEAHKSLSKSLDQPKKD